MRRTLIFLKWKSSLWVKSSKPIKPSSSALQEGLSAYAFRQASIFISLHDHFLSLWQGLKVLEPTPNHPAPVLVELEEAMQGVEGGDIDLG